MRILIANDGLDHEHFSVPRLARRHALFLVRRGHEVVLFGCVGSGAETGDRLVDGLRIVAVPSRYPARFRSWVGLWNPGVVAAFDRLLASFGPEVVHFHNVHSHISFAALRRARRRGARVFLTAHDVMLFWAGKLACFDRSTRPEAPAPSPSGYRRSWRQDLAAERLRFVPGRRPVQRWLVNRHLTRLIAVSEALARALSDNGFRAPVTIYNGLDPAELAADPRTVAAFRSRWGLAGCRVVLSGGRLSALKGCRQVLEAVHRLDRPDTRLLIAGSGSKTYVRELKRLVSALDMEQRVVFTGWLEGSELAAAYAVADVCVNPSLCFETLSMFNLEAAAAGRAVVSTFFGGAAESLVEGETGLFVNPYDVEALSRAVGALLADPSRAQRMGERGRALVARRFDAETQLQKVEALYTDD